MSSPTLTLKNEFIRAGAGAGKTTDLVKKVLSVAQEIKDKNKKTPRIVVSTFTRKATQELRERLVQRALSESPEWTEYVCNSSYLNITTLHGLFAQFLRCYGIYLGLDSSFQFISESENKEIAKRLLRRCLRETPAAVELLESLNVKSLTEQLIWYFSEKMIYENFSFADESFLEKFFQTQFEKMQKKGWSLITDINQATSDSRWLDYSQVLKSALASLTPDDSSLTQNFLSGLKKPRATKAGPALEEAFEAQVLDYVKDLKAFVTQIPLEIKLRIEHQKFSELLTLLANPWSNLYLTEKIESGFLTQSDIETLTYKVIKDYPSSAQFFSQDWDYWFFDEYQDTSPVQVQILKSFVGASPSYTVGDPQQSIYLFRGARSEVFFEKQKEIAETGGLTQEKLRNHRSEPELLEFFNTIFTKMSPQFKAMEPFIKEGQNIRPEKIVASFYNCAQFTLSEDEKINQAHAVVQKCLQLHHQGVDFPKMAILVRTNDQLRKIEKISQAYGLPLQVHKGQLLADFFEITDSLALLKFLINPHDNLNLMILLRSPWLKISDSELLALTQNRYTSLWTVALKQISQHSSLQFLQAYQKQSESLGVLEAWEEALVKLKIIDLCYHYDPTGMCEANLWKVISLARARERVPGFNVINFIEDILDIDSDLEGATEAPALYEPNRVNVMTVHASKGLQFDHVLIPYVDAPLRNNSKESLVLDEKTGVWTAKIYDNEEDKKIFLSYGKAIEEIRLQKEEQEFERLYYVALTRAKSRVSLFYNEIKEGSWIAKTSLDLTPGVHTKEHYSYESQAWEAHSLQIKENEKAEEKVILPLTHKTKNNEKSFSPTQLLDSSKNKSSQPSSQIISMYDKVREGVKLHKAFELLKFHWADKIAQLMNCQEEFNFALNQKELPLQEIIKNGYVEWGFSTKIENVILQGQVDLWGIDQNNELWLVDYKSGSSQYTEKAFAQLALYTLALKQCEKIPNHTHVNWAILYIKEKQLKLKKNLSIDQIVEEQKKLLQKVPGTF